jgi:hypothetical protein
MKSKPAKIRDVRVGAGKLAVSLADGRVLTFPLAWYPSLAAATRAERAAWRLTGLGSGIHWSRLDYDLDLEGLMAGSREHPNARRYTRRFRAGKRAITKEIPFSAANLITGMKEALAYSKGRLALKTWTLPRGRIGQSPKRAVKA